MAADHHNEVRFDFAGAEVLVTGGTSGIGHAIASAFADAGASVTATGTWSSPAEYDTELERFTYRQLDTRDRVTVDGLAAEFAALDVLVNNAGANFPDGMDEWDPDGFAAALNLNVEGAMRLTTRCHHALAASGLNGGASVVNIVSMTAFRSTTVVPGYSAAKAALVAMTRNFAAHWVTDGIRVNAVAPGLIATPMTAPMADWPEMLDQELGKAAIKRFGTVDEVAAAVLFLSSSASSFTTGSVVPVDGGYLAL